MRRERPSHSYKIVKPRVPEDSLPFVKPFFYIRISRMSHPTGPDTALLIYLSGILRIIRVNRLTLYV
jgi:hypothetical protein